MRTLLAFLLVGLATAGCKKAEAPVEPPQAEAVAETPPAEQAQAEPTTETPLVAAPVETISDEQMQRDLQGIPTSLQSEDYNSAVDTLGALGMAPMTEAQRRAYQLQLIQAQDYLRQKAESDAKAREAFLRLGRAKMGR